MRANPERMHFVSRDVAENVLEACPDAEWRLLFALSRYGGLRCPSEHLALRWADVDWERNRIMVHSSKTEHHPDGACRLVPLFPELLPYLREVFEEAEPGSEYVIGRHRATGCNLRTRMVKIIKRAGLKPWPKLFQNLRSTRETELAEDWPMHVVCAWIGNSQAVAAKHYLQVTDEHFEQAAAPFKAVQNPVQHSAARVRGKSHVETVNVVNPDDCEHLRNGATRCEPVGCGLLGDEGLEPPTPSV